VGAYICHLSYKFTVNDIAGYSFYRQQYFSKLMLGGRSFQHDHLCFCHSSIELYFLLSPCPQSEVSLHKLMKPKAVQKPLAAAQLLSSVSQRKPIMSQSSAACTGPELI